MVTHYALDVLSVHVTGGLVLLWPLSWSTRQLGLVRPDNWLGTTILVAAAALVWFVLRAWGTRRAGNAAQIKDETRADV